MIGKRDGSGLVVFDDRDPLYLGKQDMRRLFPGDVVLASQHRLDRQGRPLARVMSIEERNTHELVGRYISESGFAFVQPLDKRIPLDVQVSVEDSLTAEAGDTVVVEIIEQPDDYSPARGRIVERLQGTSALDLEIQVALKSQDIPHHWTDNLLAEAERMGSSVNSEDKTERFDLRETPFVTIDGADARDFDDAVHAEPRADGWRLQVAIADVSHYVKPGSELDNEAAERGTSVYFPSRVVPMLPEALSNGLCSLNPEVDRLTMVCEMDIDGAGQVKDFRFFEGLIRSHQRLTYDQVAEVIQTHDLSNQNGNDASRETRQDDQLPDLLNRQISHLYHLYLCLLQARKKRGAMEFESVEVQFELSADGDVKDIRPIQRNEAHRLIEEAMLCANICAAQFLEEHQIPGLYRVHLPPASEKLESLRDYLGGLGLTLGGGDQPTPEDFRILSERIESRSDRELIQTMVLRSQMQAAYQPDNKGHFGLAYSGYAHFTSPIRRYPDLLVHRAIRSLIRSDKPSRRVKRLPGTESLSAAITYPYDRSAMDALGQSCSLTERRAEEVTRDLAQWLKCVYLLNHLGEEVDATVSTATHFGLFALLKDLYVEGLIHVTNLPDDYYEFDSVNQRLVGQARRATFQSGDSLRVQIARVDPEERKVDLAMVETASGSGAERRSDKPGKKQRTTNRRNLSGRRTSPRAR